MPSLSSAGEMKNEPIGSARSSSRAAAARDLQGSSRGERAWESASADAHAATLACEALWACRAVRKIGTHPILL
jgi:hypothetical protein